MIMKINRNKPIRGKKNLITETHVPFDECINSTQLDHSK